MLQVLGKEFGVIGAAVKGQAAFEQLLFEHSRSISSLLASVMRASVAGAPLEDQVAQLTSLVRSQEKKWAEASKTRYFFCCNNNFGALLTQYCLKRILAFTAPPLCAALP